MNLKTHKILSEAITIQSPKLSKFFFNLANVFADLTPYRFFFPHYYLKSRDFLFKKIQKLSEARPFDDLLKPDLYLSYQLGLVCHYITDFFCYAHKGKNAGNKTKHLSYEKRIEKIAESYVFEPLEVGDLEEAILENRSRDPNPKLDLELAFQCSYKIVKAILEKRSI